MSVESQHTSAFKRLDPNTLLKGNLYKIERFWRNHARWLEEKGYILRPRYQPDWIASWLLDNSKFYFVCEDGSTGILGGPQLDATRISDGARVLLKIINPSKNPYESPIGQLFTSNPLSSDPRNHCVPIIETLTIPDDDDTVALVMPLLTKYTLPKFKTVGEIVELFRQLFECIELMHSHHIAHCDCKEDNFMMDGLHLYPTSPHPTDLSMNFEFTGDLRCNTDRTSHPVNYYGIDFGLSRRFNHDDPPEKKLVIPPYGGDKSVPEFKQDELCDPFPVDVYCVGNLVRELFLQGEKRRRNIGFMKPLINAMVQEDPRKRPTMSEVVREFEDILNRLTWWQLRAPVSNAAIILRPFRSAYHWTNQVRLMRRGLPAIPRP